MTYNENEALRLDNQRLREAYERETTGQLSRDQLKTMSPADINKARADGRLDDMLSNKDQGANYAPHKSRIGHLDSRDYLANKAHHDELAQGTSA